MTYFKKLIGEKCYLSPISLDDSEKRAEWFNNFEITSLVYTVDRLLGLEGQKKFIQEMIDKQSTIFSIVEKENNILIGDIGLMNVDHINRTATLGITIGNTAFLGKGFGTEATKLVLDYGFNILNLHNITLNVFEYNERAIACYKKVGFKESGRRREAKFIAGKVYDIVIMDILATEFESPFVKRFFE